MEYTLRSDKKLSKLVQEKGIGTWNELLSYVRQLPYGRNSIRTDFSLVITEGKGTCSSKHAFLKAVAEENNMANVKLILCIYRMTERNTPGIGTELTENGIDFIPEAHCFLRIDETGIDVTNATSDLKEIALDIMEESEITPEQVGDFKVEYHKDYIRNWIYKMEMNFSYAEIWNIRENCIANLAKTRN